MFNRASCMLIAMLLAAVPTWCVAGDAEQSAGFQAAFNGHDLAGWVVEGTASRQRDGAEIPVWSVADSAIVCDGSGFGFLRYDRELSDFVLKLQYRLERGVNSGVGIRHAKFTGERKSRPSYSGYEIQLLDKVDEPPTERSTGALYRYVAPAGKPAHRQGQWNDLVVECRGPRIIVTLNGQQLHDVDQSRLPEIAGKPLRGYVSLQNHGGDVAFRKVMLRELDEQR